MTAVSDAAKAHQRQYQNEWAASHREHNRALARARYAKKPTNNRGHHLRRTYNLTPEEYDHMVTAQGGVCAICHHEETARLRSGRPRHLSVDHDHVSGAIRGLLCSACNSVLGYADDNRETLLAAISYLDAFVPQLKLVNRGEHEHGR